MLRSAPPLRSTPSHSFRCHRPVDYPAASAPGQVAALISTSPHVRLVTETLRPANLRPGTHACGAALAPGSTHGPAPRRRRQSGRARVVRSSRVPLLRTVAGSRARFERPQAPRFQRPLTTAVGPGVGHRGHEDAGARCPDVANRAPGATAAADPPCRRRTPSGDYAPIRAACGHKPDMFVIAFAHPLKAVSAAGAGTHAPRRTRQLPRAPAPTLNRRRNDDQPVLTFEGAIRDGAGSYGA